MGNYQQILDQGTATSGGGTTTTDTIDVSKKELIEIQLVGDANSSDIDLNASAKTAPQAPLGTYNGAAYEAQDLTADANNSKVYAYDVAGINQMQFEIVNNAGSDTTLDAYEAHSTTY